MLGLNGFWAGKPRFFCNSGLTTGRIKTLWATVGPCAGGFGRKKDRKLAKIANDH